MARTHFVPMSSGKVEVTSGLSCSSKGTFTAHGQLTETIGADFITTTLAGPLYVSAAGCGENGWSFDGTLDESWSITRKSGKVSGTISVLTLETFSISGGLASAECKVSGTVTFVNDDFGGPTTCSGQVDYDLTICGVQETGKPVLDL